MKKHLILTSVFAVSAAAALHAQNTGPLKANIPFDFVVDQKTMPAGEYTAEISHQGVVILMAVDGRANAMAMSSPLQSSSLQGAGKLVFHRYADVYFLSELWRPDTYSGSHLQTTGRERELAAAPTIQKRNTIVAVR